MLKPVRTALSLSTSLLVFSGYLAMSTTVEYGLPILLLPLLVFALVPVTEWLDSRFPSYRKVTTLVTLCFTLAIPLLWINYGLFPTVVALVIYIQAYKLLHVKGERDYQHIFLMSFFLLVTACVLSADASIALPLLLFMTSAVWSFFSLEIHSEAGRAPHAAGADIVRLNQASPDPVSVAPRRTIDAGLFVSSLAITLACTLMTVLFFVATPRMEAGFLGGGQMSNMPSQQAVTGLAESVNLAQRGAIERDTSPVMRVQTPDEPNAMYNGPLRWRCTSLDIYNGSGWETQGEATFVRDRVPALRYLTTATMSEHTPQRGGASRLVRQVIYLDRVPENGLPGLTLPQRVSSNSARLQFDAPKGDTTVQFARARRDSLLYEVVSEVDEPGPAQLRTASDNYRLMRSAHFERLTEHNLETETVQLARQLTEPYDNIYDKVEAVERFLSQEGGFLYDLQSDVDPRRPVDYFIREGRRGHCELFASAMALMLRSVGIPARVVTGYRGGDWDPDDQAFTIRADMAHLWVEVYFIDYGWITFDPSPPEDFDSLGAGNRIQNSLFRQLLKAKMMWYQHVIGFRNGAGIAGLFFPWMRTEADIPDPMANMGPSQKRITPTGLFFFAVTALMVGSLLSLIFRQFGLGWWRGSRLRRFVLTRDQLRAIQLYKLTRKRLSSIGASPDGKTAEELMAELEPAAAEGREAAFKALRTYSEVRFGGRPLSQETYAALRDAVKTL